MEEVEDPIQTLEEAVHDMMESWQRPAWEALAITGCSDANFDDLPEDMQQFIQEVASDATMKIIGKQLDDYLAKEREAEKDKEGTN